MKKTHRWLSAFVLVALAFAVAGCQIDSDRHEHSFSKDWTSNATDHWHAATCEHAEEVSDKAAHTFGDWTVTKEATEETEGSRARSCTVCGYTATEAIEKLAHTHKFATAWTKDETNHWHAATCEHTTEVSGKAEHSFGDYVSNNDATTEADGTKTRECSVCGYKDTVTDEGSKIHVHTFAEEWTSDASGHWHAATCGHTDEKSGFAAHSFGEYVSNNDATTEADGTKTRECSVCGYKETVTDEGSKIIVPEGFVFVKGTTINGNETWTPSSRVFVRGRWLTIPDLIVSDHEVTRGEYKAVMGRDPSMGNGYDKNGNKLTGEDILNNPVKNVSWYDALVYCNKRSMAEGLTPCYIINRSTNPDTWGTVPTLSDNTWNAVVCDWKANGYRLPTDSEWEWLARGGENYEYAGSDNVDDVAWCIENTNETGTREVKTKVPNGYGLYDMSGNVWEWCYDWVGQKTGITPADGPSLGTNHARVIRGGGYCRSLGYCAVSFCDFGASLANRSSDLGFRVVRSSSK